jgi:23S rRNA (cytidine1920-2'-O)/16S rRNA (cytidine1409-2'-O)-methyltransferase
MSKKHRLDKLLVGRGYALSEKEAQSMVMAGLVHTDGRKLNKPGELLAPDFHIVVKSSKNHTWSSRGGIKLAHALDHFHIDPVGQVAIDIGCSTGGFSDVLLKRNIGRLYAVDVAYGEFDWRLRNDPRVTLLERTNARFLTAEQIPDPLDLIVCDLSFISLDLILPPAFALTAANASLVALIKPQFELPRELIGGGGIVSDPAAHQQAINKITNLVEEQGWEVIGITPSPITGMKGNKEFLLYGRKNLS